MIIDNFQPFKGQHCETTATGSLLKNMGIELSEPMLFGLGQGLHFIFWSMKGMDIPFIGGRVKPDELTVNLCRNLNLHLDVKETRSVKKAWENVVQEIDRGIPVGLKLDAYYLEYFKIKFHFAGHYVAMYGYDEHNAYLVDTHQQGSKRSTSLKSLELARNEKGPMSSPNRSYIISGKWDSEILPDALLSAIRANATNYLEAPISNIAHRGIHKTAAEIVKWYHRSTDKKTDFSHQANMMDKAGTGGALFRNHYRDFLKEAAEILNDDGVKEASEKFVEIASLWKMVIELFLKLAETGEEDCLHQAADILKSLSVKEKNCFEQLANI